MTAMTPEQIGRILRRRGHGIPACRAEGGERVDTGPVATDEELAAAEAEGY